MQFIVITPPTAIADETAICNLLFAEGLEVLHLRKPGAPAETYEAFIRGIEPRYRGRVVVHDHYTLAERYRLRGIHLKAGQADEHACYAGLRVSISCHGTEEIRALPFVPEYCFLSPVFDSISKPGYAAAFSGMPDLAGIIVPVVALGGVTPERVDACRMAGFTGVAVLGYLWERPAETLPRWRRLRTPFALSIAGFDPSSGAGVSADVKTMEACGAYGLGVCSALTFQNEDRYEGTRWIPAEEIIRQCGVLFRNHRPEVVKIGLVESFEVLAQVADYLHREIPDVKIIWDPILKATAGEVFHAGKPERLQELLDKIYLITPNTEEVHALFGEDVNAETLQAVVRHHGVNILWKGGHNAGKQCTDCLITPTAVHRFTVRKSTRTKHGTGCMLSSAVAARLAQGKALPEACGEAQVLVAHAIEETEGLLCAPPPASTATLPLPAELPLQYITAPKKGMTLCEQVEAVCRGGMRWVQLRMKGASLDELLETGRKIKAVCRRHGALFLVNDSVEAARQLDANGVHLGKEDMNPTEARQLLGKGKIIGATCNTWEDILLRQQQGVDYIGLGPYTFTTTKERLSPVLGIEGYRRLLELMREQSIRIPVFAIGGITEQDIPALMQTGIRGIALSSVIKNSNDLTAKTQEILHLISHLSPADHHTPYPPTSPANHPQNPPNPPNTNTPAKSKNFK